MIITCFVLDFDNSDNALKALKVFNKSLAEDKRRLDSNFDKISRLNDTKSFRA